MHNIITMRVDYYKGDIKLVRKMYNKFIILMYSLRAKYPEDLSYDNNLDFRNRKVELNWDNTPCCIIEELIGCVEFKWNSDKYLPMEFVYDFITKLDIPIMYNKVITIEDGITYVKFLIPVHINNILEKFNN